MSVISWLACIAIIGIIAGVTLEIVRASLRSREKQAEAAGLDDLRSALEQSTMSNRLVAGSLDSLETRVAALEKTLTDIP
jgi:type II secretory pathway pseudopilin PulG